jgi:hypothetical protein
MKKITLLSIASMLFCFCNTNKIKYKSHATAVIFDKTDSMLIKPSAFAILGTSDIYKQIDDAYSFSITTISALEHAPVYTITLEDMEETEKYNINEIPDFRNVVIGHYIQQVKDTIEFCLKDSIIKEFSTSSCFATIARTIADKEFQITDTKLVFVYSDLFEYSNLYDTYHSSASLEEIVKQFEATNVLPNRLTNTKIFIVYQPRTKVDDERFIKMLQVYKIIFEKLGCDVIHKSNL